MHVRDAGITHGRLVTTSEMPFRLWKFGDHKGENVEIEFSEELTANWLKTTSATIESEKQRVGDCLRRGVIRGSVRRRLFGEFGRTRVLIVVIGPANADAHPPYRRCPGWCFAFTDRVQAKRFASPSRDTYLKHSACSICEMGSSASFGISRLPIKHRFSTCSEPTP